MWRFRRGCILNNFRLNQIQNGPLSATIYFHIAEIMQTVLES